MQITLRSGTQADAGQIADIYLAARRQLLPFAPLVHEEADVRFWIQSTLLVVDQVTCAAMGSDICGFIASSQDKNARRHWINQLYVRPDLIRQGIGRLLVNDLFQRVRHPVYLYTFAENTPARCFYEHMGFTAIEFSDGSNNEEDCPDILYRHDHPQAA